MGNAASNTAQRPSSHSISSPSKRKESPSPHPYRHAPHPSLRTKKKSLELPDLASLAITSTTQGGYGSGVGGSGSRGRPQQISSPIAIPVSPNVNTTGRRRPQNNFSSTQYIDGDGTDHNEVHHTHIPIPPRYNSDSNGTNSTGNAKRSRGRQPRGADANAQKDRDRDQYHRKAHPPAVQEVVYSTIPIALGKFVDPMINGEGALAGNGDIGTSTSADALPPGRKSASDEAVKVKISWHGGGTNVILARAGDDGWNGRQVMDRESPTSNTFSAYVFLLPGTHHIKFLVDDAWRVADDMPTAVDDQGSLANYVNVAVPPALITPSTPPPTINPHQLPGHSFWSTSSSTDDPPSQYVPQYHPPPLPKWTTEYPPELIEAAREEEAYLASTHNHGGSGGSVPEPNIPPAPGLPRHLEKLILNVRSPGVVVPRNGGSPTGVRREREHHRSGTVRRGGAGAVGRSSLGMTSTTLESADGIVNGVNEANDGPAIPVTTASGTDVTRTLNDGTSSGIASPIILSLETEREREREKEREKARLDGPAIADDSSMLPVPSHVVLHHLSTSAIKNGVLAVGNTTRYRKKYLTTIYYKPT